MKRLIALFILVLSVAASAESTSTVYSIDSTGQVQLKGWDDASTGPVILKHLDVSEDAGVRIYRAAALVESAQDTATLVMGVVPDNATHVLISGRSGPSNQVFPHVLIELVAADETATATLYDGVWASMVREERAYPVPDGFAGKDASIRARIKNPRYGDDYRIFYLHHASFAIIPPRSGTWRPALEL